jgi:hypothetical protein
MASQWPAAADAVRVGFSAQGLFEGSYYRRMPGAADPRGAWIFDGIQDEIIGDFGLSGGGGSNLTGRISSWEPLRIR